MPYIEEKCVAGNTVEYCKYYSIRYHCEGEKRAPRSALTSEAQEKVNQRRAGKQLRRLMNANFNDGDLLVRLDFHLRPTGSEEMQELMGKAMRKLKREMSKAGLELKYIYVKEVGPRGSRHIHMLVNKCDTDLLRKCWPHGGIHVDPLISDGQYRKIAEYFIKYAARTEKTEEKLIGKRWYGSRNLIKPKVTKKVISANRFKEKPKNLEGYYLEKDSVVSGISEVTGFEYYSYTLIKDERKERSG